MPPIPLELVFEHQPFVAGSEPLDAVTVRDDGDEQVMFMRGRDRPRITVSW
jgi:hypothetical protein